MSVVGSGVVKKETACQVSALLLEFSGKLDNSVALVASDGKADETAYYKRIVGKIMGEMFVEVRRPLYSEHPELKPPELK